MNILVLGGTRFFGKRLVHRLIDSGHDVTIATRGLAKDDFGNSVKRIIIERTDRDDMREKLGGMRFDIAYDSLAYCSNDVRAFLDIANIGRYIMTSSASVYEDMLNSKESDFNPLDKPYVWCDRKDFSYNEIKRMAERALFQKYGNQNAVAVRFPYVIGFDDYTHRLKFYVDHVMTSEPMYIDNIDCEQAFISSEEAGKFLQFLSTSAYKGPINGSSTGTITLREILSYVEEKSGKKALLTDDGEPAPYNEGRDYSINTDIAESIGFKFTNVKDWIFDLLDDYMK